ncbi:vexin isoform X1 [Cygnus olor]|uniref:vexin isoform X1 n=1 Tax=Cygnus olor TaxID=8869 RepID=UPI001ADE3095|nr:vexin isoform X1 [Cygnus olor]
MHQIYSCSDENLEVFTTVISSKSCSPARRRAKSTQHILTKSVIAVSDCQPHHSNLHQMFYREEEVRGLGRLRGGQQGPCTTMHVGITERESSKSCNHQSDRKSLQPPSSLAIPIAAKPAALTGSPTDDQPLADDHRQRLRKMAEYDLTLPPGAEASLPLTGGNLCGTPSLLRKMWMKHKKKSEYLGATNSAFEAD